MYKKKIHIHKKLYPCININKTQKIKNKKQNKKKTKKQKQLYGNIF